MCWQSRALIFMLILLGLNGCYEDTRVVIHEPHIYKGKTDLHEKTAILNSELLRQRFDRIQVDR